LVSLQAMDDRLIDLAKNFEESTIDKMNQLVKTVGMQKSLDAVAQVKEVCKLYGLCI